MDDKGKGDESPEIYALRRDGGGWSLSRRDFLKTAVAAGGAAAMLAGCGSLGGEARASGGATAGARGGTLCGDGFLAHAGSIDELAMSPDGRLLASGGSDRRVKLWSLSDGALIASHEIQHECRSLRMSPRGDFVASTYWEGRGLYVFPARGGAPIVKAQAHDGPIRFLEFLPDGSALVSAGGDGRARIWSVPDLALMREITFDFKASGSVAMSPDGGTIAVHGSFGAVSLYSTSSGKRIGEDMRHIGLVDVRFSADGKRLVSKESSLARIWSVPDCKFVSSWEISGDANATAFSRDGRHMAMGFREGLVRVYSLFDGSSVAVLQTGKASVFGLAFSPDGNVLATGDMDEAIKVWSLPEGKAIATIKNGEPVYRMAIADDASFMAVSGKARSLRLWSLPGGRRLGCLADPAAIYKDRKAKSVSLKDAQGRTIALALPCGAALPAGATCLCDCVSGSVDRPAAEKPAKGSSSAGSSGSYGSRSGGGSTTYSSHYWHPN